MQEAIARAYAIYYEMPRRPGASKMPNYVPPERWEPDPRRAITVNERFMVGMAVLGNVGVWNDALPPPERPTGVPPNYFDALGRELQSSDSGRLARAVAADRASLRRLFDRERGDARGNALNNIPFQVRPLLAQANGGFLLSSSDALASWMTRGVHYACLTPIEGTPDALAFLTYVGRLFEAYALELLETAHEEQSGVRVFGEQPYDSGSSSTSDIAIVDGAELVLIEVEAHRFTKDALLGSEVEQVIEELETMVAAKARQLSDCITALRRDERPATLPGVDMDTIERIRPVVVIEGAVAQTPLFREHLEERLAGALLQSGVEELAVMSMNELEIAAGHIEHGHRLAMLIRRWKFGQKRDTDFTYFCWTTTGLQQRRRTRLLELRWQSLTDEVASAFSEDAQRRLRGEDT
jgi:hypothetical protein